MAALLRGRGATAFEENIFENRYRHVDELTRMGADIRVMGRVAVVTGVETLHGAPVRCTDLRAARRCAWRPWRRRGGDLCLRDRPYLPGDMRTLPGT